ncbi:RecQ family zinc-binding domain-containing protein, partial [Actinoplanes sp. NPDC048791]|uniref:RecQ family zinc-binding domain-containing protein n=1 Tax=Actinoplanes sp. NPDC048791 TaxID=3154623 RepID=UPI0033C67FD1
LLAARSRLAPHAVHAVVDALEAAPGRVSLRELAEGSGMSRHVVERVVDELLELGALVPEGNDAVRVPEALPRTTFSAVAAAGDHRQAVLTSRIDAARHYAETVRCRRAELLGYFGEHYEPPCGSCDNDAAGAEPGPSPSPSSSRQAVPGGVGVHHRLWGAGTLLTRDEHELTVVFDSVGYRHLTPAALDNGLLTLD